MTDEMERLERIDRLADWMLRQAKYEGVPATEVWDAAAEEIDARIERELLREVAAEFLSAPVPWTRAPKEES